MYPMVSSCNFFPREPPNGRLGGSCRRLASPPPTAPLRLSLPPPGAWRRPAKAAFVIVSPLFPSPLPFSPPHSSSGELADRRGGSEPSVASSFLASGSTTSCGGRLGSTTVLLHALARVGVRSWAPSTSSRGSQATLDSRTPSSLADGCGRCNSPQIRTAIVRVGTREGPLRRCTDSVLLRAG
jgi:hypothetical protein